VANADRRQRACDVASLGCCGEREALTEPSAPRVDAKLPARLRVHEVEKPDIRQLLLPRVPDLDTDHVMVPCKLE
jgi:hypothetical protein